MEFLSTAAITASAVVLLVQEILKLEVIPGTFANRWPVPTNLVLSIVATYFVVQPDLALDNLPQLAVQVGTVAVVAAISYNQLVKPWLKPIESK